MDFDNLQLLVGDSIDGDDCRVSSQASMVEVFRKSAGSGQPFLFVEDNDGDPVGLIAAEDVLRRVMNPHPNEMMRWMDMPVETALNSRIEVPSAVSAERDDSEYTRVSRHGRLLGVITEDDVLISWKSIQKTLKHSQGDAVTGLPNRASFDQHLQAEMNRGSRTGTSVAVILIDLDYFKQINDRFGHAAGDAALNTVGSTLRKNLRSYDHVARFGGDEFGVICSGCRPNEIDFVLRRLRESVLGLQNDPSVPRPLPSISVGAAVAHDLTRILDSDLIVAAADRCLYAAKNAGRNCAWKCEMTQDSAVPPVFVKDDYSNVAVQNGLEPAAR